MNFGQTGIRAEPPTPHPVVVRLEPVPRKGQSIVRANFGSARDCFERVRGPSCRCLAQVYLLRITVNFSASAAVCRHDDNFGGQCFGWDRATRANELAKRFASLCSSSLMSNVSEVTPFMGPRARKSHRLIRLCPATPQARAQRRRSKHYTGVDAKTMSHR